MRWAREPDLRAHRWCDFILASIYRRSMNHYQYLVASPGAITFSGVSTEIGGVIKIVLVPTDPWLQNTNRDLHPNAYI